MDERAFKTLIDYFEKIPAVQSPIGKGIDEDGFWWVKFGIEIENPLSWQVIQELAHLINYISINERLPVLFYPVSPPPYLNGGPKEFLSWVIETKDKNFRPGTLMKWLEGRLPRPVDDLSQWELNE